MAKTENGIISASANGTVVEVEGGQNILLDVVNPDLVVFSQDGSDLVITNIADGAKIVLDGFFSQATTALPPQLTLADGTVITAQEVTGLVENFDPDAVAPAAGGLPGAGGGAGFGAYFDDGIGDGIGIDGLLDPTELGFGDDDIEEFIGENLVFAEELADQPEFALNEIGLGSFIFDRDFTPSDDSTDGPAFAAALEGESLFDKLVALNNADVDSFLELAGEGAVDFIELANNTDEEQSTGGNGGDVEGTTTISVIGPEGSPVSFDLPSLTVAAGGKVVVLQAEVGGGVETLYLVFDADGNITDAGNLADVGDWPMGSNTSQPLGVLVTWSIDGEVGQLDTFLANGAQFEPASLNENWQGIPAVAAALDIFGDSDTFDGQISKQEDVSEKLFDEYAPVSLQQMVDEGPLGADFFHNIDINNIFARVDNFDSDGAADWTTGQSHTIGLANSGSDMNPQDPYNDDMDPGQPAGPGAAAGEDADSNGQNVILLGDGEDDSAFINDEGVVEGGRGQDFIIGDENDNELDGGAHNDFLDGGAGNDILDGSTGGDVLIDDQGNDILVGGTGTDVLFGRRGAFEDTMYGGGGNEFFVSAKIDSQSESDEIGDEDGATDYSGGDVLVGDELFFGASGNDFMYGGGQNDFPQVRLAAISDSMYGSELESEEDFMRDIIVAGDGHDVIFGDNANLPDYGPGVTYEYWYYLFEPMYYVGPQEFPYFLERMVELNYGGADLIYGGWGNDIILGQGGDDLILAGHGNDIALGGSGDDVIRGNLGYDSLYGGTGDDTMYGGGDSDYMMGMEDDDLMYGGSGYDSMYGGSGADVMYGEGDSDFMYGNSGNDIMSGGEGADFMYGNSGNDIMYGDGGNDAMYGGSGNDLMIGGADNDTMLGENGDDTLYGGIGADSMRGGSENDAMYGGADNDFMMGESGDDTMHGGSGNDSMVGGSGEDLMYGGADNDIMYGGTEDDVMYGGSGADFMVGESGDDQMFGGANNDLMVGGSGNDSLFGGAGSDQMFGNDGDDVMYGQSGMDFMYGNSGNDSMFGGADGDLMYGQSGDDVMYGNSGADFMYGGSGNDSMFGGADDDLMYGQSGDDVMYGNSGADFMYGGSGNDSMFGGADGDLMYGQSDDDVMHGNSGEDTMYGGDENDTMFGGGDNDLMFGEDGSDEMSGGAGNDSMFGGGSRDTMSGNSGDDYIDGGRGADLIYGNSGNDELFGGRGRDTMYGGADDDTMSGDRGSDEMYGGAGLDIMTGGRGSDTMLGGSGNDSMSGDQHNDDMSGGSGDDTLDGNSGSDDVAGNSGDDILRWTMSENAGATDNYNGGSDTDTLELYFTAAEFAAHEAAIAKFSNDVEDFGSGTLTVDGRILNASNIEYVAVHVDGEEVPVLIDDEFTTDEDTDLNEQLTADPNEQDFIPNAQITNFHTPGAVAFTLPLTAVVVNYDASDWVQVGDVWTLDLVDGGDDYGDLIVNATNPEAVTVTLDIPQGDNTIWDPMDTGDTAKIVFKYSADVEGTEDATVTINVNGVNDGPVAADDIVITNSLDPIYVPKSGLLANDTDMEGDDLSVSAVTDPASDYDPNFAVLDGANRIDSLDPASLTAGGSISENIPTEAGEELTLTFTFDPMVFGTSDSIEVWWNGELLDTVSGIFPGETQLQYDVVGADGETDTLLEFRGISNDGTLDPEISGVHISNRDFDYTADDGDATDDAHVDVFYQTGHELQGGDANEIIVGGEEADTIRGGAGDDTILGGEGDDVLIGGEGSDVYMFGYPENEDDGHDEIRGFDEEEDAIDLDAIFDELGVANIEDRADLINMEHVDGDTVITIDGKADFSITVDAVELGETDGAFSSAELLARGIIVSDES
ncbi:Ig-like domain-containing protein [Sneathiella limimaris]|uniref:Ig-like domain-containing protein n=1 Tax=Sneathiella limimaris TaxID=1964213 RepID=UPI00146EFDC2|nr:Ig-like domain-containing protein [Sneathiella limimaris]